MDWINRIVWVFMLVCTLQAEKSIAKTGWVPIMAGDITTFVPYTLPPIETLRYTYRPTEAVSVQTNLLLSGDRDWAGVFRVGESSERANAIAWNWVTGATTLLNKDAKPMPAGEYEVRLFFHDSTHIQARYRFKVEELNRYEQPGPYQVDRYPQDGLSDEHYVVYYPRNGIHEGMPVVLFLEGGGSSSHIDNYRGIMQYLASHGYFVIGGEQGAGYDIAYNIHIFESAIETAKQAHGLTLDKLAVMGHSQGGGQAFYTMRYFQDRGYGTDASLVLSIDGWFAFDMNRIDLETLRCNVAFLQMNGVVGTGTDPRIDLSIWNLASQTKRMFLTLPENNHGYVAGSFDAVLAKKDLIHIVGALCDDAFTHSTSGYDSIENVRKSSYAQIKQALRAEDDAYYSGDCAGRHYNAHSELEDYDIDYCAMEGESIIIGKRDVRPTPIEKGSLFAAADGSGESCSENTPCTIAKAFAKATAGDIVFLRGGEYVIDHALVLSEHANAQHPIVVESYPGEHAVIEGPYSSVEYAQAHTNSRDVGMRITGEYIFIRNIEVRYMGYEGIALRGSYNRVVGCHLHQNMLPGVGIYGGVWNENEAGYDTPYAKGYNIVSDNLVHDNSDVAFASDGGNADGIAVSSGKCNQVLHNSVYRNSDDGIDTWRSNDTSVLYNRVSDNGINSGDGNGIKAGGNASDPDAPKGRRAKVIHNISYGNKSRGFDFNSGREVRFLYNTAYQNAAEGFLGTYDTTVEKNIAYDNQTPFTGNEGTDNSWNGNEEPRFISLDPQSDDFLRPVAGSAHEDIGAYGE